ncbi:MAG: ATP-binding protein [Ardenticatenia bacterium]|nr:ATP-binding protein [Ardenticatenia bacterium]
MPYNPFDKTITETLTVDDLQKLKTLKVAEGNFVEYKREFVGNRAIGHSIASFANSYGGWYIVGIKAKDYVPTEVCGFSLGDYPDPIATVRDVARTHIDPVPLFFPRLVELGEGTAALVVYVPAEQETPFICKDGRIYRRTHDSSNPVPETSRHAIDRLVDAGRDVSRRFEQFCQDERALTKGEAGQGWASIFISPYPLGAIDRWNLLSSKAIQDLLELSQTTTPIYVENTKDFGTGNLPFNHAQSAFGSVIFRQVDPSRMAYRSLTTEFFFDGRVKLHIPLTYRLDLPKNDYTTLRSDEARNALVQATSTDHEGDLQLLTYVDIGELWVKVGLLVTYYLRWLGDDKLEGDFKFAVVLEDVWRSVPFLDLDEWGKHVQALGLPVVGCSTINVPSDIGKGLRWSPDIPGAMWSALNTVIGNALGLPYPLSSVQGQAQSFQQLSGAPPEDP